MSRNVSQSCFRFPEVQWLLAQCLSQLEVRGPERMRREPGANLLQDLFQY
jgi:hypothetical protein